MAKSIYYDLTGSTIALIGPFNYGMSFLSNTSNTTTTSLTSQRGKKTTTNNTISDTKELSTTLEGIYAGMWVKALTAANLTGLFAKQLYLTGCLNTNETSVFPLEFTAIDKSGNNRITRRYLSQ